MQVGLVGLGRMGANMSRRWLRHGHTVVGYARHADAVTALVKDGAISDGATSLVDFVAKLEAPRVVWLMVPAASVDDTLEQLVPLLGPGDVVVDGGNSYYRDDIRRAKALEASGIGYVDCGTSGGVWGLERGYCLMIGGPDAAGAHLDPLFKALAPGVGAGPPPARRTSGGVWGLERGYCLMIGGPDAAVAHLDPLFKALAPGVAAAPRTPGREGEPDKAEQHSPAGGRRHRDRWRQFLLSR